MTGARVETISLRRQQQTASTAAALATGFGLLLIRPLVLGVPAAGALLVAIYLLLLGVSLAGPVPVPQERPLATAIVVAMGLAAMAAAAGMAGPRPPLGHGLEAVAMSSLAAVSEEAFFRRFLYARLVRYGAFAAVGTSALLFAVVHVPAYGPAAFWVDLGAGLVLSWQRWASGGWAAPAATHVVANLLAVAP